MISRPFPKFPARGSRGCFTVHIAASSCSSVVSRPALENLAAGTGWHSRLSSALSSQLRASGAAPCRQYPRRVYPHFAGASAMRAEPYPASGAASAVKHILCARSSTSSLPRHAERASRGPHPASLAAPGRFPSRPGVLTRGPVAAGGSRDPRGSAIHRPDVSYKSGARKPVLAALSRVMHLSRSPDRISNLPLAARGSLHNHSRPGADWLPRSPER